MKVDPDTGGVKVLRYVIGYDIGRAINPTLVKGQIAGGFAQGLGGALMEEFTYNERGDPLAVTFADYLMPTVREMPDAGDHPDRGLSVAAQSARHQGRGRERGQRGRRARSRRRSTTPSACPARSPQLPVTPQRLKAIIDGKR